MMAGIPGDCVTRNAPQLTSVVRRVRRLPAANWWLPPVHSPPTCGCVRVEYVPGVILEGKVTTVAASSTLVRAARRTRRITQARLAELTGIDQASVSHHERGRDAAYSTVDRLLAGTGHRLYAAPTRRDDAASSAAAIREHLRARDTDRALRALLHLNDKLTAEHGLVRGVLGLTEPERTGDRVCDAAIAALVAWRLNQEDIPLPGWSTTPIAHWRYPSSSGSTQPTRRPRVKTCRTSSPNVVSSLGQIPSRVCDDRHSA